MGASAPLREERAGQLYLYPHPLTLARDHAEAERIRLADTSAYSEMCRTWGSLGGLTTFYRYGAGYFGMLSRRRAGKVSAEELASYRAERRDEAGRS